MFQSPIDSPNARTFSRSRLPILPGLRYAGRDLPGISASGTAAAVRMPVDGFVRKTITAENETLLEIEPLLTAAPTVLRQQFSVGTPTIYLQVPVLLLDAAFPDGQFYPAGESLGDFPSFKMTVQFSDGIERDALAALKIVSDAMAAASLTSTWANFFNGISAQLATPPLQFLNATGLAFQRNIALRLTRANGTSISINYQSAVNQGDLRSIFGQRNRHTRPRRSREI